MRGTKENPSCDEFGDQHTTGKGGSRDLRFCVAECFDTILPSTTAERVLPEVALRLHPELRDTIWHRLGWRTATTILAHALLGIETDERISALANRIASAVTTSGAVSALDHKTLVQGEGRAVAFGDRSIYLLRCSDGG